MTLTELCTELNNWFEKDRVFGDFEISDGALDLESLVSAGLIKEGQYFRIVGSVFNDGVYEYPAQDLQDETFNGAIWPMAVPKAAMGLLTDINDWMEANKGDNTLNSPYQSESFGGYSYTKAKNGSGDASADLGTWQNQFRSRLNKWRKIRAV